MTAQRTARQRLLRPNEQMLPGLLPLLTKSRAIGVVASTAGLCPHGTATMATDPHTPQAWHCTRRLQYHRA